MGEVSTNGGFGSAMSIPCFLSWEVWSKFCLSACVVAVYATAKKCHSWVTDRREVHQIQFQVGIRPKRSWKS